ncbi:MAG: hypothetical protein JRC90_12000 [Deltaproteobacteria bacterium]|nr:hypothetical protein [Deltaproteobacteria bacterium]
MKVKLGAGLTRDLRSLSGFYDMSMMEIVRRAKRAFEKGSVNAYTTSTTSTGGIPVTVSDEYTASTWRGFLSHYVQIEMNRLPASVDDKLQQARQDANNIRASIPAIIIEE